MAQYELDLRDYGRILIKRKRVILFATLLVGFVTFIITPQPKPIYKAKASVRVTQSSTMAGLFVQAISYSRWNNMETQAKIIRSLKVVCKTAQELGLVDKSLTMDQIVNSDRDIKTINRLTDLIYTQQYGKTDIIEIITTYDDPLGARKFANTLAEVFVVESMNEKNKLVDETTDFIKEQLSEYKEHVEDTESELEEFKRHNLDKISLTTSDLSDLYREMDGLMKERRSIEIQLKQLKNRQQSSDTSFIDWISDVGDDAALSELNSKLVELQVEKETLLIYQTNKSPEIIDLEKQIQNIIRDLIKEFEGKLVDLAEREVELTERLDKLPQNDLLYNRLTRELRINEEIYSLLRTSFQEAKIKQSERVKEMSVVEYATYSQRSIKGGKWSKTILGLVVGMLLGLVVAFVLETLDTSIGAIQDVEEYLGTTVLGVIPHFDMDVIKERILKNNPQAVNDQYLKFHSMLATQFRPKSPIAEAYRTLATNIDFVRLRMEGANQFVVTSATMQEGKSTTIANLAIAMAQMGHRTLLVGCNLRRPVIYKIFGLEIGPGIRDISLGMIHWREAVRSINDIALGKMSVTEDLLRDGAWSRLSIITCGAIYHNPSEILSTPKMVEFLRESKDEYDVVIMDSPPVLPVTDAAIMGSKTDGLVLVYQVGKIARGALRRAKQHLEAVNAQVWGVVLNDFKAEISGFSPDTAYYGKYYGQSEKEDRLSKIKRTVSKVSFASVFGWIIAGFRNVGGIFHSKRKKTEPPWAETEMEGEELIEETSKYSAGEEVDSFDKNIDETRDNNRA
ncbi:MAG: polysaccharide biosynthesis tyrosine autokinase [candidate division Zixibacteria bacterium]|nr:polysaccharide biosynthesis tyrosine autokinase [Candidatus Tariuqbacter arcticus]